MRLIKNNENPINESKIINQIRALGIDMISEANSGHPGIVLGAAPILYSLYAHHLRITPDNPNFYNRDRFIMSAGHGSALLYATLYMAGFHLEMEDLKNFRKIHSKTPGHPEYKITPGVDMTTGPLGQGIATAVGMAMAEARLREKYNKYEKKLIDFHTYVLCGDGDLMEGVSYEALSLAGNLKLNKLIVLYDSNEITLDGKTKQSFDENIKLRFEAIGFNYTKVNDGEDYQAISKAIEDAKKSNDKPTIIEIKTTIGKFSMNEGTNKVHGGPLAREDITNIKERLKLRDITYNISNDTIEDFQFFIHERCAKLESEFEEKLNKLDEDIKKELAFLMGDEKALPIKDLEYIEPDNQIESTRDTSSKILNSIMKDNPYMLGGSADLFGATKTYIKEDGDYSSHNYLGSNIFFGVREHAMGAILNGLALCGYRVYGSTFLTFSNYLIPAIRMAAILNLPIIYIFTHDSISIGEDGPTHQPVEQLAQLRVMPNIEVYRPCDANEVIGTYKIVMKKNSGPSVICLSKTNIKILDTTKTTEVENGAYIIRDSIRKLDGIIISTGEEVHLALEVANRLSIKGIDIRVVSMPSMERFIKKEDEYKEKILPIGIKKIVLECASSMPWNKIVFNDKYLITLDEFGYSGTKEEVYQEFGFDIDSLEEKIENLLK
ncbi:MAG: transketolase [Bacilli bacterium]|nr:transketolase [Bacilli bacterium]